MISEHEQQKLWSLMKKIKVGMMVTQDGQELRSRPMHIVQNEFDGSLWFFSDRDSAKVYELKKENHVCISFEDRDKNQYLSVSGIASTTTDRSKKMELWNPLVGAWFEQEYTSPEIVLIKIDILKAELWETDKNSVSQIYEIAKAAFSEKTPDIGENRKYG